MWTCVLFFIYVRAFMFKRVQICLYVFFTDAIVFHCLAEFGMSCLDLYDLWINAVFELCGDTTSFYQVATWWGIWWELNIAVHQYFFDMSVDSVFPSVMFSFGYAMWAEDEICCFGFINGMWSFIFDVVVPGIYEPVGHDHGFFPGFCIECDLVFVAVIDFELCDFPGSSYGIIFQVEYELMESAECGEYLKDFVYFVFFQCVFSRVDWCYLRHGEIVAFGPVDESLYAPESYAVSVGASCF